MDWHGLLAWIEVGETLRVQPAELEELISIRGDIDVHGIFEIVFSYSTQTKKNPQHRHASLLTFLTNCGVCLQIRVP